MRRPAATCTSAIGSKRSRLQGWGCYFLECIFADIDALRQFAGIHESVDGYQRMLSKRFPYAIFYEVVGNVVRISAVLDCRRDPDWIHKRLRSPRDA